MIYGSIQPAPMPITSTNRRIRVPMAGFIPCYNLQAAVSAVACERLRQLETAPPAAHTLKSGKETDS